LYNVCTEFGYLFFSQLLRIANFVLSVFDNAGTVTFKKISFKGWVISDTPPLKIGSAVAGCKFKLLNHEE